MRSTEVSDHNARRNSINHINSALEAAGITEQETVGSLLKVSIEAILLFAGEHGSCRVDEFFGDPQYRSLYKIPLSDEEADSALRKISVAEAAFWQRESMKRPSEAAEIAVSFSADDRYAIVANAGKVIEVAKSLQKRVANELSGGFGFPVESDSVSVVPYSVAARTSPLRATDSRATPVRTPALANASKNINGRTWHPVR
ncbi:hypothetical protein ACIQB5_51870 [Streptomyces sp. NPDC088560]|uniref:hypothetical protein n=1 Tax=Streptomyces sp. NPDC088560 TaxID=3365868 RepID=UPI003828932A